MSISQCVFRGKAAMEAPFAAPDTQALVDDVPNFADLPMQGRLPSPMENGVAQPAVLA